MPFSKKDYQREYMREYMRKRRAPEECKNCAIYRQYCDGITKVTKCPQDLDSYEELISNGFLDDKTLSNHISGNDRRYIKPLYFKQEVADELLSFRNKGENLNSFGKRLIKLLEKEYPEIVIANKEAKAHANAEVKEAIWKLTH